MLENNYGYFGVILITGSITFQFCVRTSLVYYVGIGSITYCTVLIRLSREHDYLLIIFALSAVDLTPNG